ncbi:hypothetical protein G7K_5133-t1 [Saitoella complicata NRRL Y-17804]|uniref:Secreted protein n=1 Tax=Saitoella complicata (strain BCRC 22490 / CBS 7301 / JCM 7358 / NBRC 10748 / NRRL Y-17804) TaxID=698492 RepID=A0A0E9NMW7_SAICN|nr:hypothetical protein G7K_5133-t1 [Saitoella complicata NRRL Y-17804]
MNGDHHIVVFSLALHVFLRVATHHSVDVLTPDFLHSPDTRSRKNTCVEVYSVASTLRSGVLAHIAQKDVGAQCDTSSCQLLRSEENEDEFVNDDDDDDNSRLCIIRLGLRVLYRLRRRCPERKIGTNLVHITSCRYVGLLSSSNEVCCKCMHVL